MAKQTLTDRKIKTAPAAPAGERYEMLDVLVPGLGVRVYDTGRRLFMLKTRFPGSPHPTRRTLGDYPALSLEQAREKAGEWRKLIKRGIGPSIAEKQRRQAALQALENTFGAAAEDFIAEKLPTERKGAEVERDIRREFMPAWRGRPITEISDLDVIGIIKAKKRTAPAQARNLLGIAKRLFAWAVDQRKYGLVTSPAERLKPKSLIGERAKSQRILGDIELFALWRAATRLPYPYGPAYQLLIQTALRLNEVADTAIPEVDFQAALWTVPARRMKGKNGTARPHAVPVTRDIRGVFDGLPRFKKAKFYFSTNAGASPVWIGDKIKKKIDARMVITLRAVARIRGEDPDSVVLEPWKNHDIRRTVRSGLSRLKVAEETREAVLAHVRPGIKGTYDLYDYFDEKREALELWAERVRSIATGAAIGLGKTA